MRARAKAAKTSLFSYKIVLKSAPYAGTKSTLRGRRRDQREFSCTAKNMLSKKAKETCRENGKTQAYKTTKIEGTKNSKRQYKYGEGNGNSGACGGGGGEV